MKYLSLIFFLILGNILFANGQAHQMTKQVDKTGTVVNSRSNSVRDSLEKVAATSQMQPVEKQQYVNANMLRYYKGAYAQLNTESIEESLIEIIKQKEASIDQLNARVSELQQENYRLSNPGEVGMVQQPLGILQLYFPNFDFNSNDEEKARKLLEAIQFICNQKPDGKEIYESITEPEKRIAEGDFHSLYKYRLQMICLLIKNN